MNTIEQCVKELLIAGSDDWVYLAEALRIIESVNAEAALDVKQLTLEVLGEVVQRGLMEVGDLPGQGCRLKLWPLTPQECLARIEREWDALGRSPSLGEICWLQNTDKGDALGEQLRRE
jgi:hypothetical protein